MSAPELTDEDWEIIKLSVGKDAPLPNDGPGWDAAIFNAGLAAGERRERERCARLCDDKASAAEDKGVDEEEAGVVRESSLDTAFQLRWLAAAIREGAKP